MADITFKGSEGGSTDFGSLLSTQAQTVRPIKQEKSILKVAVLSEPYFPKQKLAVRFDQTVLKHMELDDLTDG